MAETSGSLDPQLVELAHEMFDLARAGDEQRLAAYVDAGVPVDLTDSAGNTLLMLASYHGHVGTVVMLAGRGADLDRVNDRGQSPLAGAVFKDELAVVHALLAAGADPDGGSPTARDTAAMFGRGSMFGDPSVDQVATNLDTSTHSKGLQ